MKQLLKRVIHRFICVWNKREIYPVIREIGVSHLLDNRVALVIGGGGIGQAIIDAFIKSGCKVIVVSHNEDSLKIVCSKYNCNQIAYLKFDLLCLKELDELIKQAVKIFGKIDILVNSAGTHTSNVDFWTVSEEEYDRVLNTNLKGCYFMSRAVAKYMKNNNINGHILNIGSSVALEPAWSPYRISKLGLEGMTKGLAKILLPYHIIVNCISPDTVATKLNNYIPDSNINTTNNLIGRMVLPQEIANYALLLVSDLGNMVIGDTLYISGGRGIFDVR